MLLIALAYLGASFWFLARETGASVHEAVSALCWPATRAYRFVRKQLAKLL